MITKLLRGLGGFAGGDEWMWEPHDEDWIYQGGPTGHLHEVYFNQWQDLDTTPVEYHINAAMADKGMNPFTTEPWQLEVNGIY